MHNGARFSAIIDIISTWYLQYQAPLSSGCPFNEQSLPFDYRLQLYFRKKRYIGSKDKKFIRQHIYDILRQFRLLQKNALEYLGRDHIIDIIWLYIAVYYRDNVSLKKLTQQPYGISPPINDNIWSIKQADLYKNLTLAEEWNISDDALDLFKTQGQSHQWIEALLHQKRILTLRGNPLFYPIETQQKIIHLLKNYHIHATILDNSLYGVTVPFTSLYAVPLYQKGIVDIQSRESQLACEMVDACEGMTIIDYCAGAGGKALFLGAHTGNKAKIIVHDTHKKRLQKTFVRAEKQHIDLQEFQNHIHYQADRVIVDAPCTGSGNWHKNPDQALIFNKNMITLYSQQQLSILQEASNYVAPQKWLIYMTCSVFKQENDDVIKKFLHYHPDFILIKYRLFHPISQDFSGFYVAIMEKTLKE